MPSTRCICKRNARLELVERDRACLATHPGEFPVKLALRRYQ